MKSPSPATYLSIGSTGRIGAVSANRAMLRFRVFALTLLLAAIIACAVWYTVIVANSLLTSLLDPLIDLIFPD
jgi:hypothetical protein